MNGPKISILTVTYQAAGKLQRNIRSIDDQTYPNWEHVLVDGGSTDGTLDIIKANAGHFSEVISEPDKGIGDAMRKAADLATGDWLIFLQSDDFLLMPESLDIAAEVLSRTSADIVGFDIYYDGAKGRALRSAKSKYLLSWKMVYPHQGMFIRRDCIKRFGNYLPDYHIADYEHTLRCFWKGAKLTNVPLVVSVMEEGGFSSKRDWKTISARIKDERRAQFTNIPRVLWPVLGLYWALYYPYKWARVNAGI